LIGLLVLYPVLILFANSLQVGQFGTPTHVGFDNWTTAFGNPKVASALENTLTLTAARQAIGSPSGCASPGSCVAGAVRLLGLRLGPEPSG
jgi:hypothetical protein